MKTENIFQAKQTLQSIIDNYEGEKLRNEAIEKLGIIVQQEKEKEALIHSDSLETERDTISIEGEMIELN